MANEKDKNNLGEARKNGLLVSLGPGKSVLMPNIYAEDSRPVPEITFEDQLSAGDEESAGFNPYDTAVLYER